MTDRAERDFERGKAGDDRDAERVREHGAGLHTESRLDCPSCWTGGAQGSFCLGPWPERHHRAVEVMERDARRERGRE